MKRTLSPLVAALWIALTPVPAGAQHEHGQESEQGSEEWTASNTTARDAFERGDFVLAEKHLQAAVKLAEGFGPADPRLGTSLNNLAVLYGTQERYEGAEPLLLRVVRIWEDTLGAEHLQVAEGLTNLATLYGNQGKYQQAEPLYRRALGMNEKLLGPDDSKLLIPLSDLAEVYREQQKFADAETCYRRLLSIAENAFGPDHLTVAVSLERYALLLRQTDQTQQAEKMEARARAIRAKPNPEK